VAGGQHNGLVRAILAAWGRPEVVGPLGGGHRNPVLELRRGRERLVARWSRRSPASLDWEIGLLGHLARHGLRVPDVVPALDGRCHVDGVVVQAWLDGTPPGPADWPAVAAAVRQLHELTAHWPQRPGFASTRQLRTAGQGGDVDLAAMPREAVATCRQAWAALAGTPQAVVHGDLAAANIRMSSAGPGLLDWDEARVDYTDLDLADLPDSGLPSARLSAARRAVAAWEAASGWRIEPGYARRQLALLGPPAGLSAVRPPRQTRPGR
jgi:Ser/Thr protein kinase RdoA (MazF antagonist)